MPPLFKYSKGFTLVELLTTIAIVGVLAAILLPVIANVKQSARNTKCVANLRQLGQASVTYIQEHDSALPQLDYQYINVLFPYIYPGHETPQIASGEAFPKGLENTIFQCPSMDATVINSRGYAINDRLAQIQMIETDNGEEANKWSLPMTIVQNPEETAIFSDTYTTSNMSRAMRPSQSQVLDRHEHINVVFLDGHVEGLQPSNPRIVDVNSPFWKGTQVE